MTIRCKQALLLHTFPPIAAFADAFSPVSVPTVHFRSVNSTAALLRPDRHLYGSYLLLAATGLARGKVRSYA
ncbi:hypothetical protein BX600DRAFT_454599 [Xylariales sp. PMI_506]|nr:hypothetical protein BX600DRAFT_454599 [Xylariales sp. PMI_506]